MIRTAAVIVRDSSGPLRFAGLDMADRAVRVARRSGVDQIRVVDDDSPFAIVPEAAYVLVLPERTIAEPAALRAFLASGLRPNEVAACLATATGEPTDILLLSSSAFGHLRSVPSLRLALKRLLSKMPVAVVPSQHFVTRVRDARDIPAAEREYMTWTNGGDNEGYFTRNIRVFSIPVSRRLVRLGLTANHVTIAGFGFACASGAAFARGTYAAGIVGAALYWISMILDCSDGEVARATLSDSRFGAWLETATDYLSYFVVLGGIVWGDAKVEGFCKHVVAALVAAAATLAIVLLVGCLRARVAADNPGAFDDALAADLQRGTRVQRFAAWGRQLIKRAFVAHLIVFQAAIGMLPALTEIWAYGAVAALAVVLAVHTHIIRSVRTAPLQPSVTL